MWKKLLKILLIAAVVGLVLVAALFIGLKYYLTPDRVHGLISQFSQTYLKRQVDIGSFSITFKGLRITRISISEKPDFSKGTFITAERFGIGIQLLSLLHRQILIQSVEMDQPTIHIIRNEDGVSYNFSDLIKSSAPAVSPAAAPLLLLIDKVSIKKGRINVNDASQANGAFSMDELNLEIDRFSLTQPFSLNSDFNVTKSTIQLSVRLNADVGLKGTADIKEGRIATGQSEVMVTGMIREFLKKNPQFENKIQLSNIMSQTVETFFPLPPSLRWEGPMSASADVSGSVEDISFKTRILLDNIQYAAGNNFKKPAGVPASFSASGQLVKKNDLLLKHIELQLASLTLSGKSDIFNIRCATRTYTIDWQSNEFDVSDMLSYVPVLALPSDMKMMGSASFKGHMNARADNGNLTYAVNLTPLIVDYDLLFQKKAGDVCTLEGSVTYQMPLKIAMKPLIIKLGTTIIEGKGAIDASDGKSVAAVDFKTKNLRLHDFAQLIPLLKEYDPQGSAEVAVNVAVKEKGIEWSGKFETGNASFRYNKTMFSKIKTNAQASAAGVSIPKLTGMLDDTPFVISLDFKNGARRIVKAGIDLETLDIDKLLPPTPAGQKPSSTVPEGTSLKTTGRETPPTIPVDIILDLTIKKFQQEFYEAQQLNMQMDVKNITADFSQAAGTVAMSHGEGIIKNMRGILSGNQMLRIVLLPLKILDQANTLTKGSLNLPSLEKGKITKTNGIYDIKGGILTVRQFDMEAPNLKASMKGTIGLTGMQELALKAAVKAEISILGKDLQKLVTDEEGLSLVNLSIKGTLKEPKVSWSPLTTGTDLLKHLEQGLGDTLLEKFKKKKNNTSPPATPND